MYNALCKMLGIEFPLFAFSHCRDVVAAVSRAGGFGVLGGSSFTPDQLELELQWLDRHLDGKPYGVDILVPENLPAGIAGLSQADLLAQIPDRHRQFTVELLHKHGVEVELADLVDTPKPALTPALGEALMEVAFAHPIKLIANALGIAPQSMIQRGRRHGVPVAALVGAKEHAIRQAQAGVDIIVAQGTEAGGHCGEISTLVLIPEVLRAIKRVRDVPVLAAGGIMTGRQMAACVAMGAAGAWTGSIWLATAESDVSEAILGRLLTASSRDTVRSKFRTGKPSRQLRSAWHEAWESADSPGSLPLPQMGLLSEPAFAKIEKAVARGNHSALPLLSYWVGQGVGLIEQVKSARQVVLEFQEEFAAAATDLYEALGT
jgi:NAD(P)H-dependent flavin oxidoreductase YrpB (nitropropane dioxygenase family)